MKQTLVSFVIACALAACGGKGGDLADRAGKAADGACACKDFDCTKPFIADLNKMSISEDGAVKALAPERAKLYHDAQTRAADCQDKLRK
jgi:hypothetical protein